MDSEYQDEKKKLERELQNKLDKVESELKGVQPDLKSVGTTTLLVGGLFVAGILLGRLLFKKKKAEPYNDPDLNQLAVKYPKEESYIAKKIKEHISIFLIAVLKERLSALLKEPSKQ